MSEENSRNTVLSTASIVSAVGNAILATSKIVVGFVSGSLAVLGDGIDSATDVLISLVMIFTSRIVKRPPDKKYVFGYEKAESIGTKLLSFVIFYAGVQMLITAIRTIFSHEVREMPSKLALYITIFSIVGKLSLAWHQLYMGKKINSSMLKANAVNMRNDVIISCGVLAGLVFTFMLKLPILDVITSLLISAYIIKSAVGIFMESNVELMDGVQDDSIYEKIFAAVDSVPEASNAHRVRSRQIGGMYIIALDIEVDGNTTLNEAHAISETIEQHIRESIENVYDIIIHMEPIGHCKDYEKFGVQKDMIGGNKLH
ncbi:MAG: cation diffusion facilitator family transporter [Bacteroidales bacterium]|jgi:cation diffusion facilitator family transporter|nr:cation diffusion facilitator family transporter [Bacteroidales bacterium]